MSTASEREFASERELERQFAYVRSVLGRYRSADNCIDVYCKASNTIERRRIETLTSFEYQPKNKSAKVVGEPQSTLPNKDGDEELKIDESTSRTSTLDESIPKLITTPFGAVTKTRGKLLSGHLYYPEGGVVPWSQLPGTHHGRYVLWREKAADADPDSQRLELISMLNLDASYSANDTSACFGLVLCDDTGRLRGAKAAMMICLEASGY
ncbi:hypothetical protein BVC80_59g44 [Macleaya cordata]|uniref:Uncharacterized protein n=1 Tax=Macleaya cordata TaxID=56857 RepID=A0A200QJK6_MACCD|nr:hypothetical protein BVC80_59g44 [Macleaya cordata]